MENKELKQPIPEELKDGQLEAVAGGQSLTDAAPGMTLPYYVLDIMYEKTAIQQMLEVEKLKEAEKLLDEARNNSPAYLALSELNKNIAGMNAMSIVHQTSTGTSDFPSLPPAELSGTL